MKAFEKLNDSDKAKVSQVIQIHKITELEAKDLLNNEELIRLTNLKLCYANIRRLGIKDSDLNEKNIQRIAKHYIKPRRSSGEKVARNSTPPVRVNLLDFDEI